MPTASLVQAVTANATAPPHDLGDLPVQQAMHRAATRGLVRQLAGGAATQPPEGPHFTKLQHPTGHAELSQRAAVDFDEFYATRSQPLCEAGDVLVLSCDGKGVVMRSQALRPATAKAATSRKLATRL